MASFVKVIVLLASLVTFCYTFYVVGKLTLFLSKPRSISTAHTWIFNLLDNKSRLETAYGPIVFDTLYVIGFIFQHSFIKSAIVKNLLRKLRLAPAERTIYTLTSSLCLHVRIYSIIALSFRIHQKILLLRLVSGAKLGACSIDCTLADQCG